MTQRSRMLDEAMSLGQRELDSLVAGDVFEAEKLAHIRERILDKVIKGLSPENLEELADKLKALKTLHDKVTDEALRLRQSLKQELTSMKKQTRRIAGYSVGSGNVAKLARERFISKKS